LLRPRLLRPFPEAEIRAQLAGKRGVAVIDQNISLGKGGVLHTELLSALHGQPDMPNTVTSFIGGLGGRDISPQEFYEIESVTRRAIATGDTPPPRLLYTDDELREIRKLQAIASVEHEETAPLKWRQRVPPGDEKVSEDSDD
jgi:pyruvate ferredoxin oxidoreductase alpha subunit